MTQNMSTETTLWMRTGRKIKNTKQKSDNQHRSQGRNVIFRTLMPGVFCYLVAHYVFVEHPTIADFYCDRVVSIVHQHC